MTTNNTESVFCDRSLILDLAEYFDIPNNDIIVENVIEDMIWFRMSAGASYTAKTVRRGSRLKKNSIRTNGTSADFGKAA